MKVYTPMLRAYRQCGFHNRTLKELRLNPELKRGAILDDNDPNVAHVPNAFGTFVTRGITYKTSLTIAGIEEPTDDQLSNGSRGASIIQLRDLDETTKLWQFMILLPKRYCFEDQCPGETETDHIKFCNSLTDRTDIFAMEFLCCYRFFIEQVLETYEKGNCEVREPLRDRDPEIHPKQEEADALICTYHAVGRNLEWLQKTYPDSGWEFTSVQQFLDLHVPRNRRAMLPYYFKWLKEHRVRPQLVEKKTLEFISMAFLEEEFES